jgi:hypothetical protein
MLSLFGFGKKRRSVRSKKHHAKPPAKLLTLCKKYRVKATKKVGRKRVYKKVSVLKKLCLRKAMALKKKLMKMHKRKGVHTPSRKNHKVVRHKSVRGDDAFGEEAMSFGARSYASGVPMFGVHTPSRKNHIGNYLVPKHAFGKRRRGVKSSHKVSKAAAMKAFRSFYKRHCHGARRMRFGNGGNPPLAQSMGYEFCPSGMGGVLGANSTGLFGSPCTSATSSFGASRRRRAPCKVVRRRRSTHKVVRRRRYNVKGSPCNRLSRKVCRSSPNCVYTKRGCRRRGGKMREGPALSGPAPKMSAAELKKKMQFGKKRKLAAKRRKLAAKRRRSRSMSPTRCYMYGYRR